MHGCPKKISFRDIKFPLKFYYVSIGQTRPGYKIILCGIKYRLKLKL